MTLSSPSQQVLHEPHWYLLSVAKIVSPGSRWFRSTIANDEGVFLHGQQVSLELLL
jgi:hypothetical protein